MSLSAQDADALISEGTKLKAIIKTASVRLKEIEADLLQLPAGKYRSELDSSECSIIEPSSTVKIDDADALREITGDEAFKKLTERSVVFKPVKSFREVAAALLPKGALRKLLALCEKPSTPYIKWGEAK